MDLFAVLFAEEVQADADSPPSDWNVPIFSYKPLWVC